MMNREKASFSHQSCAIWSDRLAKRNHASRRRQDLFDRARRARRPDLLRTSASLSRCHMAVSDEVVVVVWLKRTKFENLIKNFKLTRKMHVLCEKNYFPSFESEERGEAARKIAKLHAISPSGRLVCPSSVSSTTPASRSTLDSTTAAKTIELNYLCICYVFHYILY